MLSVHWQKQSKYFLSFQDILLNRSACWLKNHRPINKKLTQLGLHKPWNQANITAFAFVSMTCDLLMHVVWLELSALHSNQP